MESFTMDLFSVAAARLFPDDALRSLVHILPGRLNLGGQWEVAFSEKPYPSMNQNLTECKINLVDKKLESSQSFTICETVLILPSLLMWKPSTHSFKRDTIRSKFV